MLSKLHQDSTYIAVQVGVETLPSFVKLAPVIYDGFNVTMPLKTAIIPFLRHIDNEALMYNAVNTVVIKNEELYGYNTDGEGFCYALSSIKRDFKDMNVVILGCGGAGGMLTLKAVSSGCKSVAVFQRKMVKSDVIIAHAKAINPTALVERFPFNYNLIYHKCKTADILINATPLGMSGMNKDFKTLEFLTALPQTAAVCDLIYAPLETRLLLEAKKQGLDTLNGMEMLITQARFAEELFWKDTAAPN